MPMGRSYKRHLTAKDRAAKIIIEACVANCAGIECLPDAPSFRYTPPELALDSFKGREEGPPSDRGSVACGRGNPHKLKNWSPSRLDANPMYRHPMRGDSSALTKARTEWAKGFPGPLRVYLSALAAHRRAQAELFDSPPISSPTAFPTATRNGSL